jgi:hypothetical protein
MRALNHAIDMDKLIWLTFFALSIAGMSQAFAKTNESEEQSAFSLSVNGNPVDFSAYHLERDANSCYYAVRKDVVRPQSEGLHIIKGNVGCESKKVMADIRSLTGLEKFRPHEVMIFDGLRLGVASPFLDLEQLPELERNCLVKLENEVRAFTKKDDVAAYFKRHSRQRIELELGNFTHIHVQQYNNAYRINLLVPQKASNAEKHTVDLASALLNRQLADLEKIAVEEQKDLRRALIFRAFFARSGARESTVCTTPNLEKWFASALEKEKQEQAEKARLAAEKARLDKLELMNHSKIIRDLEAAHERDIARESK